MRGPQGRGRELRHRLLEGLDLGLRFEGGEQQALDLLEPAVVAADQPAEVGVRRQQAGDGQREIATDPVDARHHHPGHRFAAEQAGAMAKRHSGLVR